MPDCKLIAGDCLETKQSQCQAFQEYYAQQAQNVAGVVGGTSPAPCTGNVQLPEDSKPWYKKLLQLGGK